MQKKIPRRAKNVTFLEHLYFTRQRQVNISTTKVLGFHIYPEIKCYIPFQSRNDTNLICTILVFSSCARIVVDLEKIAPGENPFVPQHKEGYYSHHFIPDIYSVVLLSNSNIKRTRLFCISEELSFSTYCSPNHFYVSYFYFVLSKFRCTQS